MPESKLYDDVAELTASELREAVQRDRDDLMRALIASKRGFDEMDRMGATDGMYVYCGQVGAFRLAVAMLNRTLAAVEKGTEDE